MKKAIAKKPIAKKPTAKKPIVKQAFETLETPGKAKRRRLFSNIVSPLGQIQDTLLNQMCAIHRFDYFQYVEELMKLTSEMLHLSDRHDHLRVLGMVAIQSTCLANNPTIIGRDMSNFFLSLKHLFVTEAKKRRRAGCDEADEQALFYEKVVALSTKALAKGVQA